MSRTRRRARPRSRAARCVATALAGAAVLASMAAPVTSSGAWFTASQSRNGNTMAVANLQPVSGLSATARNDGVNIRWGDAQQQVWATANRISAGTTYTLTRTVDGQNPTVIYSGPATSASDPYPKARQGTARTTLSSGQAITGGVQADGTVWTWGIDDRGSLGTGTTYNKYPTQVPIPAGHPIVDLMYAGLTAAATSSDGTVWSWGPLSPNNCGGGYIQNSSPVQIPVPSGRTILSATSGGNACKIFELASDGTLWAAAPTGAPEQVTLPGNRKVAQLTKSTIVLAADGTVWGWGNNSSGQLGNGKTTGYPSYASPEQAILPSGTYAKRIAADTSNSVFLLNDNTIWVVGSNDQGQLGAGISPGASPKYPYAQRFQAPTDKTWIDVSAGNGDIAALASDGSIYTAGASSDGQLGNGMTRAKAETPVPVTVPDRVQFKTIEILDVPHRAYALDQNNTPWGWGANYAGTEKTILGSDASDLQYNTPIIVASERKFALPTNLSFCDNGGTANSAGFCVPSGSANYTLKYSYQSWSASAQSVPATTTAVQTGTAVVSGPGGSSLCLNIRNNGNTAGTPVEIAACDPSSTGQKWTTWSDGTFRANGLCLDMKGRSPGSIVQLWPCNGLEFQWWVPRSDGSLYNPTSGLCLSDPSGNATPGTQQQIATCDSGLSQRWNLS